MASQILHLQEVFKTYQTGLVKVQALRGINLEILAEISGYLSETFAGNRPTVRQSA